MEEHKNEVKVVEELIAVLQELRAHFHLTQWEFRLFILGLARIELTFLSFRVLSRIIFHRCNGLD